MKKLVFIILFASIGFSSQNIYSKQKKKIKGKIICNFAYQIGVDWTLVYCETCSNIRAANRNNRQSTCN